jgi:hypothetical protein
MSPELETLDQLLGGDAPLSLIRDLYENPEHFTRAMIAMLEAAEVRVVGSDGIEIPRWRWHDVLSSQFGAKVSITAAGVRRIG